MSLPLLFALASLVAGAKADEEPEPRLSRGKQAYQRLDYEECLAQLSRVPKDRLAPALRADLELHLGLCHYHLGRRRAAEERFAAALAVDASVQPPPYTSPKVVELFQAVAARPRPAANPPPAEPSSAPVDAPVAPPLVPRPAEDPPVDLAPAKPWGLRPYALPLGLSAGALVAAGFGTYFGTQAKALERQANEATFESDAVRLGQRAQAGATAANVSFGLAASAAAGALVAYLLAQDGG